MTNVDSGYIIKDRAFRVFKHVLKKWLYCNKKYFRLKEQEEVAYCWNERASISVLAAAIWMSNGVALEEYCSDKKKGRQQPGYRGRIDLWARPDKVDFVFEAKHYHSGLDWLCKEKSITDLLRKARSSTQALPDGQGRKTSIIFISPYLLLSEAPSDAEIRQKIGRLLACLRKTEHAFLAWWFPKEMRQRQHAVRGYDRRNYLYPGIAVIAKALKKK